MSNEIDISLRADGAGDVDRIVSAIDRMHSSLEKLGNVGGLSRLEEQVKGLQSIVVTGFATMAAEAEKGGTAVVAAHAKTAEQIARDQEKSVDRQLNVDRTFRTAQANQAQQQYDKQIAADVAFSQAQLRIAAKRAEDMASLRAKGASKIDARTLLGLPSEAEARAAGVSIAAQMREAVAQENLRAKGASKIDARTLLGLPSEAEARSAGAALAAQFREGVTAEKVWAKSTSKVNPRTLLGLPSDAEMTAFSTELKMKMRAAVDMDNLRAKSAPKIDARTLLGLPPEAEMAGFAAQLKAQMQAVAAAESAQTKLPAALANTNKAQRELNAVMKDAEGVFKGAAHQSGIYGLAHGQLITLLAGGALAGALHHIAITGAEVEYALSSVNALSEEMNRSPMDLNRFVGITAGTLSNVKQAAEGIAALAEAGFNQADSMAALPAIMRLATMGNMSVAQSAEMAVESMHAFGKTKADISDIGDILLAVGSKSNVSVHKLAEDMKSAATTGELFHLSMEEITATVGVLAERGLTIQPLSSALMKLYEPNAKVAAAMKEMGVSMRDDEGHLLNYTKAMDALQTRMKDFAEPADFLKKLGMGSRDIKGMEALTQHWEDYMHLLHEANDAHGKMFSAMIEKEDTVEGAYKRLHSTIEGTFIKAFDQARPVIREVEESLMRMAGAQGAVDTLAGLAEAFARLTLVIAQNAKALGLLVAAYFGLRMVAGLATVISEFSAAQAVAAAATRAQTVALAAQTTQMELFGAGAVIAGEGAAVAGAGAAAFGAGVRVASVALGGIGIVLALAVTAFELFRSKQSEAEASRSTMNNTINTTIDAYKREIEQLKAVQDQLMLTGEEGVNAARKVALAQADMLVTTAKASLDAARTVANAPHFSQGRGTGAADASRKQDVTAAENALKAATDKRDTLNSAIQERDVLEGNVKALRETADLKKKISEFPSEVTPTNKSASALVAAKEANSLLASVRGVEVSELNQKDVREKVLQIEKDIKLTRMAVPGTKDAAGARDEANEEYRRLQGILDLKKQDGVYELANAQRKNRRGELGDLQLITLETQQKVDLDKEALSVAQRQAAIPGLKKAQVQEANNHADQAKARIEDDTEAGEDRKRSLMSKYANEELAFFAQTQREKGNYEQAFLADYEAKYTDVLSRLDADIKANEGTKYAEGLERYKKYLLDMGIAGKNAGIGQDLMTGFDKAFNTLDQRLSDLRESNGVGTGLASMFERAHEAAAAYEEALPDLIKRQKELQTLADTSKDPGARKGAIDELAKIRQAGAAYRNIWVGIGDTIADSLAKGFGRGGAALGGLLKATVAYNAKRKQIDADYLKSDKSSPEKLKAAQIAAYDETTNAQISSYADMSAAAKGFFAEGTRGYAALAGAEKAFRLIEMALTVQSYVQKSGLLAGFTGLFVTAKATETAATVASVGPDVAASAAKGTAAAAAGVAAQASGDPYTAWARMAAMAVAMAALGFAVAGGNRGGGGRTAAEQQKVQGTGSYYDSKGHLNTSDLTSGVFGDSTAQSNSIKNSLDMLEKYSGNLIPINLNMLNALRAIQTSMEGLTSMVVRANGLTEGTNMGIQEGQLNAKGSPTDIVSSVMTKYLSGFGTLNFLTGPITGFINNLWGKVKANIVDSGIQFGGSVRGLQNGQGFNQYASVDTTTSSWFGLKKSTSNRVETQGVGSELSGQFGQLFKDLEVSLTEAAKTMGGSASAVTTIINGLKLDNTQISLKGLTGDALTTAINAVLSKAMDQMSAAVFPALDKFRKVGEGYTETVMRLATDYGVLDNAMQSIGSTFGWTGISSLTAREHLISLAGGIDKLSSQTKSFADNFLTEGERLAPVQKYVTDELARLGFAGLKTRDDFKTAVLGLANSGALATEKGAQLYASLLSLSDAFAEVTPPLVDVTKSISEVASEAKDLQDQLDELTMTRVQLLNKEREQLDPSNRALFDQIQRAKAVVDAKSALNDAYEKEQNTIQDTIDRLSGLADSWKKFRDGLLLGDKSILTPGEKYLEAKSQFNNTVSAARGGDVDAQARYEEVANNFLEASKLANASSQGYTDDFNQVVSSTDEAISWASQQVDIGKASLTALEQSVAGLIDIKVAVMSVADALHELMVAQSDYQAHVPPVVTPTPGTPAGGATQAQMDALLAEVAALRAQQAAEAAAAVDAAHAGPAAAAQQAADDAQELELRRSWNIRNMKGTVIV